MTTPKASQEVRTFLAAIGAKGGKTVTPAKRAHLQKIAAKGGKTLSGKRLAQIREMTEKRVAKQSAAKAG
jgi:hypothetical protein